MANFENKGQYLLMTPSRDYSLSNYKEALGEASALCKQYRLTKILADARTINQSIPEFDRFELGVEIAKKLGANIKLAILMPVGIIDKLGENAAVNRGGKVYVTSNMDAALDWLGIER